MPAVPPLVRSGEAPVVLALGVLATAVAGPRPLLLGLLWLAAVTPRLVETDLALHRLPDAVVLPGYPVVIAAVALDGWTGATDPAPALLAGAACGLVLLVLHAAGGMGLGDVKLAPLLGALASALLPGGALLALVLAFLAGGLAAVAVLIRRGPGARLAFGPPLLLGAWTAVLLAAG